MSLALQCLVALTLLVAGAVAALPPLLSSAEPSPDAAAPPADAPMLRLVEAPGGRWYLRGDPISRSGLEALLRSPGQPAVAYLPSAALRIGEVAASLRWLRRISAGGAVLSLPPVAAPPGTSAAPGPVEPRR